VVGNTLTSPRIPCVDEITPTCKNCSMLFSYPLCEKERGQLL
jgi:hypothetical protein